MGTSPFFFSFLLPPPLISTKESRPGGPNGHPESRSQKWPCAPKCGLGNWPSFSKRVRSAARIFFLTCIEQFLRFSICHPGSMGLYSLRVAASELLIFVSYVNSINWTIEFTICGRLSDCQVHLGIVFPCRKSKIRPRSLTAREAAPGRDSRAQQILIYAHGGSGRAWTIRFSVMAESGVHSHTMSNVSTTLLPR